ncbi:uncharacterized protein EV422DRAFT_562805 [Fimicolochytrium jonesii]|uniref:uncharacterized protein n=1 Tax=Fimicolochytrium jonesii TaxID=1396493 RepID=UPI0022FE9817|nr:uncharacterized protein EV422DRAFT_562805 [Fimicolochytrium jonesii]KAI8826751.1 hypothetical protein EV422DRAFT_562805 [Fimicolochytrium jonesii]
MADHEGLIAQLADITGCSADQAKFFLEASNWNVEDAASSYYESSERGSAPESAPPATSSSSGPFESTGPFQGGGSQGSSSKAKAKNTSSSRVKTFSELLSGEPSDSEDASDDEQNFYAGGEKSGLMMQGGPKSSKNPNDLVKDILEKASKAGPGPEEPVIKPQRFTGSGYRLGNEDEPATSGPSVPVVRGEAPISRYLTFWRNGFSIDDGELRAYDAPENQEFLRAINSGRAPTSLLNVAYDQPVEVKVTKNLEQDYVPPAKKPMAAFSGTGNRLGGIVSGGDNIEASIPGAFPGASSASSGGVSRPAAPVSTFKVDDSQPVTSLQIRLADGTRLVTKANHTHTIGDIRGFVNSSRPENATRRFVLQTAYPVKELSDDKVTLKDAGLINAVIVQRFV